MTTRRMVNLCDRTAVRVSIFTVGFGVLLLALVGATSTSADRSSASANIEPPAVQESNSLACNDVIGMTKDQAADELRAQGYGQIEWRYADNNDPSDEAPANALVYSALGGSDSGRVFVFIGDASDERVQSEIEKASC